ncbi:MAG: MFS transporter, partial [Pseudolabrys sp.]|nr:MFS transporter [Pseudolabrys sp.]
MPDARGSAPPLFNAFLLLWLSGCALRLTILAVPPVIPRIHDDLQMNATQVGVLTGLPSLLFALAAVPGSLLIARLGVRSALVIALLVTAAGGALRGAFPSIAWLDAMTIVMGAGVAIMQVTMPPTVRAWVPHRIPFATAVYTNGLLIGEILPVALTLPLVLPLLRGSWQWSLAAWSVPVVVIAAMVLVMAPPARAAATRRQWWPNWRDPLLWRLGLMLGSVNATYFGINAFLPDYLNAKAQGEWIGPALSALNIGQLPVSFVLLAAAGSMKRAIWPYAAAGSISIASIAVMVFGSGIWIVVAAAFNGFAVAGTLVLILALPPLLAPPGDVHRVTAAMFT